MTHLLREIARAQPLQVLVDLDALERSARARIDATMVIALDALGYVGIEVLLLSRCAPERASSLARVIRRGRAAEPSDTRSRRSFTSAVPRIVISDEAKLLRALARCDRGIALGDSGVVRANVTAASNEVMRSALRWLVDARSAIQAFSRANARTR